MPVCTLCERKDAVFVRPYSGERLCKKCFCKSIEKKVQTTISEYEMFKPDDVIIVGLSGGKDSTTLLHVLAKIERHFARARLYAVTIDEGIRGYRNEALKMAMKNCKQLNVEHKVTSFKEIYGYKLDEIVALISKRGKSGLTPCSYCGVLRRRALNIAAREARADKLATAHNLDDEAQTTILNIIHGDALRIARVKPVLTERHPKLIQRVKPLCEIPEREIALYTYMKKIKFQSIPCPYAHEALRNDVRIMLNRMEEKHPGTKFTIFRSIEKIRPALETTVKKVKMRECRICGEATVNEICQPCRMLLELGIL